MPKIQNRTYRQKRDKKELGYKKSKDWASFYNDHRWSKLRSWYMKTHPLCENCLQYGISTPATDCHHKIPFRLGESKDDKWDLFLNPDNLEALCESCHHLIHNQINKTQTIPNYVLPEKLNASSSI